MRKGIIGLIGLAILSVWTLQGVAAEPLRFAFLPYMSKSAIMKHYGPLAEYLGEAVGRPVLIEVAATYDAHIWAVERDDPDIAFLGAAPYVTITDKVGPKPLLARFEFHGEPTFHSVVFARKDSLLKNIDDLKGHSLALGSHRSTLSHIVPRHMLKEAGIAAGDMQAIRSLKTHDDIVYAVLLGSVDAGAVAQEVFEENLQRGLKMIAQSEPISTHVFVAHPNMPMELRNKLRDALMKVKDDPAAAPVRKALGTSITGFAPVADADYDNLRRIMAVATP